VVTTALRVDRVSKSFDGKPAVIDVSFEVAAGSVVALLGPNGAGKTTLLELVGGFSERDSGSVSVLGHDPQRRRTASQMRDRIGFVAQVTASEPTVTARELLTMFSRYYSDPLPLADLLDLGQLGSDADKRLAKLSGGQRRRVDLLLGIVGRPKLLFLDEPTTGLDAPSRRALWDTVRALQHLGTTIVLTTHQLEEAQALAQRILVMRNGSMIADAPTEEFRKSVASSTITFRCEVDPRSSGLDLEGSGGTWTMRTTQPVRDAAQICEWALLRDAELHLFTVQPPSLEDAYLSILEQDLPSIGVTT
jgi:ABC-2 type transport system ATP-binding protein